MNVPKLRFKEDTGQEFPEWKEKAFQEICKINQGLQIPISERYTENGEERYFYITNEFLKKGSNVQYFIKNPPSSVLCSDSDVLMTRTGNTGKVVTGVNGAFHNNFFKINYDRKALNKTFLCEFLSREKTQFLILKLAGTSTIPDLNHSDFYKITIWFPSLPEQTKIANFLTAIDERISQLTQKCDLLAQYKKGVMQQIFSQQIRFKDDDGREFPEWVEKKLREISNLITKGTTPKSFSNKGINFIKIECFEGNKLNKSKCLFIDEETHKKELKRSVLSEGDILFAIAGTIGKCNIVSSDILPANTNQALSIIRLRKNENKDFVYHILNSNKMQKYIVDNISVGAQPNLNLEQMGNFLFLYPSFPEQTKIANFLTAIDDKITHTQAQLAAIKQYKQGLLQQMFV